MKQEAFCVVAVPATWTADVPGIPTMGAWTDPEGQRHVERGRLIHHSVMDYDSVFELAKSMGEQSFVSVDVRGFAHLVWTDGRKPERLGRWVEVRPDEVRNKHDYTYIEPTINEPARYFRAGGV